MLGKDSLSRSGLAALLGREPALVVVGQAPLDELDAWLAAAPCDVLAIDAGAGLEGLHGLESAPPAVVLVEDEAHASEALLAGARGVLTRDAEGSRIAAALVAAAAGLLILEPRLSSVLLRPRATAQALGETLTPREAEVLQHLSLGLSNKAIAARLGISDHTAKFHVNAILAKLGAGSRSEAIVRAARAGLVAL